MRVLSSGQIHFLRVSLSLSDKREQETEPRVTQQVKRLQDFSLHYDLVVQPPAVHTELNIRVEC